MLHKIFFIALFFLSINTLHAQNVGIGTTTPNQKLDIANGRLRFTGNPGPAISQGIEFTNPAGTNLNGFLGTYNDSITGMYGFQGSGWSFLHNNKNGNLGLQGNSNPRAPLSFASTLGNKIALWGNADEAHFGLGIQNSQMQLYTNSISGDITFGYGNSSAFTENMRIKGNGNVGIGTASPDVKLDIVGRLQTSEGANFGGNVDVGGKLFALSTISTDASLFVSDDATIDGAATIGGDLQTQGSISTAASLNVSQNATINGAASIGGDVQTQGSISTAASLNVSQNATINGNIKIAGGAPDVGKVLTSDAYGNASWKSAAVEKTERFSFQLFAPKDYSAEGILSTRYTTGSDPDLLSRHEMRIFIIKPGLYHFEVHGDIYNPSTNDELTLEILVKDGPSYYSLGTSAVNALNTYAYRSFYLDRSFDLYLSADGVLNIKLYYGHDGTKKLTVLGHKIAD